MSTFSDKLDLWYTDNGRDLPWRGIDDPYRIWLSEIILQQTRIEQGRDYYLRFVEALPTVEALASTSEQDVLRLWQGLGYYSRARNMHSAARHICDALGGRFPTTYDGLLHLPGVGRYTASAVASFAFGEPRPVIDGNVYRFICRLRAVATPVPSEAAYRELEALLTPLIAGADPARFNAALMDFGSLHCRQASPLCQECPFADQCQALARGMVASLPTRVAKRAPVDRFHYYLDLRHADTTIVHQRTARDIWRGLYELPLIEADSPLAEPDLRAATARMLADAFGLPPLEARPAASFVHKLTHRTIHARFLRVNLDTAPSRLPDGFRIVTLDDLKKIPVSRLIDKYLSRL